MGTCPADMERTMITENGERRKLNGAHYGYRKWREKKMMKQELQQDFAKKIEEAYWMSPDKAQKQAEEVLARLPDCLIPNIREWLQGTILTDICIQDYSIPMILAIWDSQDFLGAVQVMAELEENPAEALRKIWNMRR